MIVKCKICGKEFEARQSNHRICSPECRKINNSTMCREWHELNKDIYHERALYLQRKRAKPILCKICGKPVDYHVTGIGQHRRYHYHRDCLINEAIAAIVRGEKFKKGDKNILMVAANKGYQKADLLEIMAERGIKYGKQKPFAVWRG